MKDGYGRVIDRLRVSVTDRCDLRCVYCMPARGARFSPSADLLSFDEIESVVRFLVEKAGLRRVRITGGEPLVRPGLVGLVGRLAGLGLEDLAMTTNAQLLAPVAEDLRKAGLARVNVSLDSLDGERFRRLGRAGEVARTIEGIDAAIRAGLRPVKLNMVLLRGWNDDEIVDVVRFAAERKVEVRFLELMAIGESSPWHEKRFLPMDEAVKRLREVWRLDETPLSPGSTSVTYDVSNGNGFRGAVGFIAPVTRPFCSHCRRLRLSADGLLRGCLMNPGGVDLMPVLRGEGTEREEGLRRALHRAIAEKPWVSDMETGVGMHALGG
ncbi:MAG: GTP 3',8-cyclase MoaA [Candidatus Eisenbacteria bacterium]